jgi:hypothetical protein
MKIRNLLIAGVAALGLLSAPGAKANVMVLCSPDIAGGIQGPRTIGGTNSLVPSGTVYALNSAGCGVIKAADTGWFLSQGYTQSGGLSVLQFVVPVAATGTTSYLVGTLPPSTYIRDVFVSNTDASHAVTGGIDIGSTSGGTDIVAAANLAVGTSSVNFVTDANLAKRVFSVTAGQAVYATGHTSWNTPTTVTITITYGYF